MLAICLFVCYCFVIAIKFDRLPIPFIAARKSLAALSASKRLFGKTWKINEKDNENTSTKRICD